MDINRGRYRCPRLLVLRHGGGIPRRGLRVEAGCPLICPAVPLHGSEFAEPQLPHLPPCGRSKPRSSGYRRGRRTRAPRASWRPFRMASLIAVLRSYGCRCRGRRAARVDAGGFAVFLGKPPGHLAVEVAASSPFQGKSPEIQHMPVLRVRTKALAGPCNGAGGRTSGKGLYVRFPAGSASRDDVDGTALN